MASENLQKVNKYLTLDSKDKDGNEGRWVTMRGTHVFIKKGESPAQALKRQIIGKAKERGKTPIKPEAKPDKKETGYAEKSKLQQEKHEQRSALEGQKQKGRMELQKRKEIDRQARSQGKEQKQKEVKYERKDKGEESQVQKFIEKTGFDRETAERQLFGKSQGDEKLSNISKRKDKLREMSKGKNFGKIVGAILDTVAKFMVAATTGEIGELMNSLIAQYEQLYKDQKIASKEKKPILKEIEGLYEDVEQYRKFYQLDELGEYDLIVGDYPVVAYSRASGPVQAHARGEGVKKTIQEAAKKRFKVTVQKWNPMTKQWINMIIPEEDQGAESEKSAQNTAEILLDKFLKDKPFLQVRAFVKQGTRKGIKLGPYTNLSKTVVGKTPLMKKNLFRGGKDKRKYVPVIDPLTGKPKMRNKTLADKMRQENLKYNASSHRAIEKHNEEVRGITKLFAKWFAGNISDAEMKTLKGYEKKLDLDLSAIIPPNRIPKKMPSYFKSNLGDVPIVIRMIGPQGVHGQEPKGGYGAIFYENPAYTYMDPKNKKGKFLSGGDEIYRKELSGNEIAFFISTWSKKAKKVNPRARYRSYSQRKKIGEASSLYGNYFGYDLSEVGDSFQSLVDWVLAKGLTKDEKEATKIAWAIIKSKSTKAKENKAKEKRAETRKAVRESRQKKIKEREEAKKEAKEAERLRLENKDIELESEITSDIGTIDRLIDANLYNEARHELLELRDKVATLNDDTKRHFWRTQLERWDRLIVTREEEYEGEQRESRLGISATDRDIKTNMRKVGGMLNRKEYREAHDLFEAIREAQKKLDYDTIAENAVAYDKLKERVIKGLMKEIDKKERAYQGRTEGGSESGERIKWDINFDPRGGYGVDEEIKHLNQITKDKIKQMNKDGSSFSWYFRAKHPTTGREAGFAEFSITRWTDPRTEKSHDVAYLGWLHTETEWQRKGVATALSTQIIAWAEANQIIIKGMASPYDRGDYPQSMADWGETSTLAQAYTRYNYVTLVNMYKKFKGEPIRADDGDYISLELVRLTNRMKRAQRREGLPTLTQHTSQQLGMAYDLKKKKKIVEIDIDMDRILDIDGALHYLDKDGQLYLLYKRDK